jgi:endogenous inhibitor of DNA gyrase (YacG/DUF329 family)
VTATQSLPIVACPRCGKESLWNTSNSYRPFCSERCKMIDLGKWADEAYRVGQCEQDPAEESPVPVSLQN